MQPRSDAQLLRDYAERGMEAAFAELVERHTNLVYSAALRQVQSPDIAAEIAQNVFVGLARGAKTLAPRLATEASLAGWLCRSARNLSLNHRRDEFRRLIRERHAMEQFISISEDAPNWEHLSHVLDDAMSELTETDYDALVMRFYQNQDFRAVGVAIGVSDDTAQKRVSRALDKLRELLAQRGIRTTAAALGIVISANAVQSAPIGLAVTISTAVALTASTIGITMIHKLIITGTTALAIATGVYSFNLHDKIKALRQEQASLAAQLDQLSRERDDAKNQLAALRQADETAQANESELLKLRNEVTLLRRQRNDMPATAQPETNSAPVAETIQILLTTKFVSLPTEDLQGLGVDWTQVGQGHRFGTLTEQQFKIVNEALQGASDADLISAPRVVTDNGGAAEVSVTRPVPVFGTNAAVGTALNVIPFYLTNSSTFNLSLSAKLSQLTGDPSQPNLQTIQVTNQASLAPGQVVVLETEIPPGGWLPDVTNVPAGPRSLLVFVTPRVVAPRLFQKRQ